MSFRLVGPFGGSEAPRFPGVLVGSGFGVWELGLGGPLGIDIYIYIYI